MEKKADIITAIDAITNNNDDDHEFQDLMKSLEQHTNWDGRLLVRYNGFLIPSIWLRSIISCRENFKARDTDIVLATLPKSGTTWLKALTFTIVRRDTHDPNDLSTHPLLTRNPHQLVTFFEYHLHTKQQQNPELERIKDPRIFGTHMPYTFLPDSIMDSSSPCKMIYICRNPLDQFISYRQFNFAKNYASPLGLSEALDSYVRGIHSHGPFWEHNLGYWKAHLKNPEKVLFLKYEDLKGDTVFYVRKIAEFLGFPFSDEEERRGVPEMIKGLCSFENLSKLEVNKNGGNVTMSYSSLFRKGEVGDWRNHVTTEMAERAQKIIDSKFEGSGLNFKIHT